MVMKEEFSDSQFAAHERRALRENLTESQEHLAEARFWKRARTLIKQGFLALTTMAGLAWSALQIWGRLSGG